VDLNLTHCIYCKRDQTADNADAGGGVTVKQELQLKPDPDAAPAAAAAAAAGASNPPAAGGVRFNTVVTCSTCPAVFHASCYEVNTGEQVSQLHTNMSCGSVPACILQHTTTQQHCVHATDTAGHDCRHPADAKAIFLYNRSGDLEHARPLAVRPTGWH
jgi:hypothetical protein